MKRVLSFMAVVAALIAAGIAAIRASVPQVIPPDGEVYALQAGSTLTGMKAALQGQQGTLIMMKDQMVTFIWSVDKGWAFATLNGASRTAVSDFATMTGGKANLVNFRTMIDVRTFLENCGWAKVSPDNVPDFIRIGLTAAAGWARVAASNMVTFIVLAPGFEPPEGAVKVMQ